MICQEPQKGGAAAYPVRRRETLQFHVLTDLAQGAVTINTVVA